MNKHICLHVKGMFVALSRKHVIKDRRFWFCFEMRGLWHAIFGW